MAYGIRVGVEMLGLEESVRFGVITHLVGNHLSLVGRSAWGWREGCG